MSNLKFITASFVTLVIFLASCSKDQMESNAEATITNEYSTSILLTKMANLNDSLIKTRPTTRGVFERGCIIAGDISGAVGLARAGLWAGGLLGPQTAIGVGFIGGLIGAVSGSYVAYCATYHTRGIGDTNATLKPMDVIAAYASTLDDKVDIEQHKPKIIDVDYPIQDEDISLMGARHNVILQNLLENKFNYRAVENYFTEQELEFLNSKVYTQAYDSIMSQIEVSGGLSVTGDDLASKLVNLFNQLVAQYPQAEDDMEYIINKYIEAVKASSEVSDEDKKIIYQALSVAASSYEYWNNQLK